MIRGTAVQIANSPWLARVQEFIRSPLSADSSPSHADQSRPAASRQLMPELARPQVPFPHSALQIIPPYASAAKHTMQAQPDNV